MNFNNTDRAKIIKNKTYDEAYSHIVNMAWWSDDSENSSTTDSQRELFLYREFFEYYNLLTIIGISGFKEDKQIAINQLKIQLDTELNKMKNHIYNY